MPGRWNFEELGKLTREKKRVSEIKPEEVSHELLNRCGFFLQPAKDKLTLIEKKRVLLARAVLGRAEFTELVNALSDERTFAVAKRKLNEDFAEVF